MVLEDLHELIETLQARIDAHASALQQSEALTRYALIDPLLRGLGWETGDPSQVLPEYRSAAGSADYALLGLSGSPQVIVEAKKLGTHLDVKVRQQVTSYCQEEGVPFAVITDGRRWEIYDIFQRAAMKDSIIATLNLGDAAAKICLQALALWRPSVIDGSIRSGVIPMAHSPQAGEKSIDPSQPTSLPPEGWLKLSDFIGEKGMKPRELRFPSGTTQQIGTWSQAIEKITQWLVDEGYLSDYQLPISRRKGTRYILSREARHPNGTQFKNAHRAGPFFIETNFSVPDQVENIQLLIERIGQDTAGFAVRLQ